MGSAFRVQRSAAVTIALGALFITFGAVAASAQTPWTYRARVAAEVTASQPNTSSPRVIPGRSAWESSRLFVASGDSSWDRGGRLRFGAGVTMTGSDGRRVDARAREAFARVSLGSWMDLEAGKRLLRWGVGYGFSPTGVLDPARVASDPNDRLGRNEGLVLARGDVFRGATSLTVAAAAPRAWRNAPAATPDRVLAARLRTVLDHGVEVALIVSAAHGARLAYGGNVTHVVGRRLEWHAELVTHERAQGSGRALSAVAGLQYTFAAGANVVVEYHRNGHALKDSLFIRAARTGSDHAITPELIAIAGLNDGSWTLVSGVTWTPKRRVQVYGRASHLFGGPRSIAAFAPWSTALTAGTGIRF